MGEMNRMPSQTYGVAGMVNSEEERIMLSQPGPVDAREFRDGTRKCTGSTGGYVRADSR